MSSDIGGMVFFEWLLEDGEIEPDLGDKRLQEEHGELLDNSSQFTTKTIDNSQDHDISDNLDDRPSNEETPKAISEGGKYTVKLLFISISLAL